MQRESLECGGGMSALTRMVLTPQAHEWLAPQRIFGNARRAGRVNAPVTTWYRGVHTPRSPNSTVNKNSLPNDSGRLQEIGFFVRTHSLPLGRITLGLG